MVFEQILTGGDRNFGYLVGDGASKQAAVVDPSYSPEWFTDYAGQYGFEIKYIINTHADYDHVNGNDQVREATGAQVVVHTSAQGVRFDRGVNDGDELSLGSLTFHFLHTPGHTPDSMCILVEDALLTGDTLFVGKVGGSDYGEGARRQYESLHKKLMVLDDSVRVFPGHNVGVAPDSTIGHERETNPFLQCKSLAEFIDLKRNWQEYKRKHGIA